MKISKHLIPHAQQRLYERFNMLRLPEGKRELIKSLSNNRKVYRVANVYFIWRKSDHKILTFLTEQQLKEMRII
jgi:hypothetical protein